MFPVESIAKLPGTFSCALVAVPPSPENPAAPVPAIRVIVPLVATLKMQLRLVKYKLPVASVANACGLPMLDCNALAGVGGAPPPAIVLMVYCWAQRIALKGSARIAEKYNFTGQILSNIVKRPIGEHYLVRAIILCEQRFSADGCICTRTCNCFDDDSAMKLH